MYSVVVHYGELALKGRNRPWFIHTLVRSIRSALAGLSVSRVQALVGRVIITFTNETDWAEIQRRVARLPGVGNFALARHIRPELEAMTEAVLASLADVETPTSFRVLVRRADKRFAMPSPDVERHIGARVQQSTGWRVDLSNPGLVIRVEILTNDAFFFVKRERGVGGLPIATGGRVLTLLSGGIDSPVAAWRLIRRGCRSHFVHFHSFPILSSTSQEKARALVTILTRSQLRSRLYLVAFGGIQQRIVVNVPPPLRVVIYRRMMLRIAEALAKQCGAHALVTGDSVGQVASQTVDNLGVVGRVATLPVLRPLVGMDKEEITLDAQRVGTYETSIVPDEDCCTLFTPRYPSTRAPLRIVEAAERQFDVEGLVAEAVAATTAEVFRFPEPLL
jgi:tRNA uracil 4-sulfurtransferase